MFSDAPRNIGIACGPSGLLVVDEDAPGVFAEWAASLGQAVPATFTVRTGRPGGGWHHIYGQPAGVTLGNAEGSSPDDIDIRGAGGFLVGPGSLHASGNFYLAEDWDAPTAELPLWLVQDLTTTAWKTPDAVDGEPVAEPLPEWLADLLDEDASADRSKQFHKIVCEMRAAGFTQGQAVTVMAPWCNEWRKFFDKVPGEVARSWGKASRDRHALLGSLNVPAATTPAGQQGDSPSIGAPPPVATPSLFLPGGFLNVGSPARLAEWLRYELGRNELAGVFQRGGELVYTPAVGEDGYVPPPDKRDDDGPAQVRPIDASRLASRCQYTYRCAKIIVDKETKKKSLVDAMFPASAAKVPVDVPDMLPNVRHLRGVVHAPALRPDGTIIEAPGYDDATGLLYLPQPGLVVPPVRVDPSDADVKDAVGLIDQMLDGFKFASHGDRSNYIGLLLTPLLRTLLPPPYKLGCIGAPMRGSGKSLLASILRIVHGGVFRAEVPKDEAEVRKAVSTILDVTTAPVVQLDNVTGVLSSSTLAALLTSSHWDDRLLGTNRMINAKNDRLWVVTGNNLNLGGDLVRRALWVTIDPGVPAPHLRTGFDIDNLEAWARDRRGDLIHALLTLTRAWVAAGSPKTLDRSDSYAEWAASLGGLLDRAGIPGGFDTPTTARQTIGEDDSEWAEFLEHVYAAFGEATWQVRDVVNRIPRAGHLANGTPAAYADKKGPTTVPSDALPQELADKFDSGKAITRSLGKWLANRKDQWAGSYAVTAASEDNMGKIWRVRKAGPVSEVEEGNPVTTS